MSNTVVLVLVLAYGVISIAIGAGHRNLAKSSEGFLMGGRSLGVVITLTSLTMGILSGLAFFGTSSLTMRTGNIVLAAAGFGISTFVYPWFGYKLWKYGKQRGYRTTADYMRDRYYSTGYGHIVSLIQLLFMIPYMTVQFVAIGNGLSYFTELSYMTAIVVFAIFLTANLFVGGAKGVGAMDIFNVSIGVLVPLILCILAIRGGGGLDKLGELALKNDPNFTQVGASSTVGRTALDVFVMWLTGIFAILFSPHILGKMMMVKDISTFKQMQRYGPLMYIIICTPVIFLMGWIGIALYKPALTANGQTDFMVQHIMADHGNPLLTVFMLCALMAFAMSTANAFAISCANIIATDFAAPSMRAKGLDGESVERKSLLVGKIGVIAIILLCLLFATSRSMFITDYAYALATPGFAQLIPGLLGGLFWKRPSRQAAVFGTIIGFIVLVITTFILPRPFGIHQVVWSLGANAVIYLCLTFTTKPPREIVESFFPVKNSG